MRLVVGGDTEEGIFIANMSVSWQKVAKAHVENNFDKRDQRAECQTLLKNLTSGVARYWLSVFNLTDLI